MASNVSYAYVEQKDWKVFLHVFIDSLVMSLIVFSILGLALSFNPSQGSEDINIANLVEALKKIPEGLTLVSEAHHLFLIVFFALSLIFGYWLHTSSQRSWPAAVRALSPGLALFAASLLLSWSILVEMAFFSVAASIGYYLATKKEPKELF